MDTNSFSCIVGIGTGLGNAFVRGDITVPSEIAHIITNETYLEDELKQYFKSLNGNKMITYEGILSSNGFLTVFKYLNNKYNLGVQISLEKIKQKVELALLSDLIKSKDEKQIEFRKEFKHITLRTFGS